LHVLASKRADFYNQNEFENDRLTEKGTGQWLKFDFFYNGWEIEDNMKEAPVTAGVIKSIENAVSNVHGTIKFSVLEPGSHIAPHCGPTNARLRLHLGLQTDPGACIVVAGEECRAWQDGEAFVFDDSFEHEVFHNGTQNRIILILDFWPVELDTHTKRFSTLKVGMSAHAHVYKNFMQGLRSPLQPNVTLNGHPRFDKKMQMQRNVNITDKSSPTPPAVNEEQPASSSEQVNTQGEGELEFELEEEADLEHAATGLKVKQEGETNTDEDDQEFEFHFEL
jgi:hypothetical protein